MANPKTFTKQSIVTTSDQDALQIKDVTGTILGWIDSSGTGQGNLASGGGSGTTINPTNNVIPVRSSSSAFADSPFYVASSTNVLMGTQTAVTGYALEIHETTFSLMSLFTHNSTNFQSPELGLYRSRGSVATPTVILSGDQLGYLSFKGYDGSSYINGAQITCQTGENWSGTNRGISGLQFLTTQVGASSTGEAFRMNNTSNQNNSNLDLGVISTKVLGFTPTTSVNAAIDTAFSRLGAASVALGNGTASDTTGNLSLNKIIKYNAVSTVSGGVPAEYATVDLTAQNAAIVATTLYAVPSAGTGMYRISWSASITTADGASSVLGGTNGFQVVYTSPTDSVVKTTVTGNSVTSSANTTGAAIGGCQVVYAKASTNIQYKMDYTSGTPGQMVYELHIKCEAL